jgi:hypothetical protein
MIFGDNNQIISSGNALMESNYELEQSFQTLAMAMERINTEGTQTASMFQQIVDKQTNIIVTNKQVLSFTDEQRIALGGLQKQVEDTNNARMMGKDTAAMEMEINKLAYQHMQNGNVTMRQALVLAETKVRKDYEQVISENAKAEAVRETSKDMGQQRMQLMQLSIGMFVLGITTTQTFGAIATMVGKTTELGVVFTELGNSFKLLLGPMQIYMALQQLMIAQNKELLISSIPVMLAFGSLYLLYKGFTHESKAVRAGLAAIGAAMAVVTVATWAQTAALWAKVQAQLAAIASNPSTALSTPVYIAAVIAAVAAGIAASQMGGGSKGQTIPGYGRVVKETGLFYAHKGETVGRIGNMSPTTNNKSVVVHINVASGGSLDRGMIPQLSREIEMAVASGNGV